MIHPETRAASIGSGMLGPLYRVVPLCRSTVMFRPAHSSTIAPSIPCSRTTVSAWVRSAPLIFRHGS
ncbi:hypothetical protein MB27_18625 [Actinoplanes utahensis]|uniref:Uncharacterized protein n=2 Tax=Actinoplanes utahensis TaxID=1869 RepID=A0A0A6UPA5_ACTUT|nr:hypothetical protein MB27_18625 [Actinoplanes utahensis]